ncbi:MAG: MATE family efflux transporter [Succinivibrio sp.]
MQRDLTQGSVLKNIVVFSLPYFLAYFLQTLYGLADLFIIGLYNGVESTTAVSIGSQIMHMVTVMIVGLAMGSTVSIAHATGAKDQKMLAYNIGNTATVFFVFSCLATLILVFFISRILSLVQTPSAAVEETYSYLLVCFLGIPFITAYNVICSVLRGLGDSKSPMYFIAVACLANIVLDYIFIGLFSLGALGAALGTTISQLISVMVALAYIHREQSLSRESYKYLRPRSGVILKILRIGFPIFVQDGFIQVAFIVITVIANMRGLVDAASVGIVEKIIGFIFLVPSSLLSTVSAMGAQNIGGGRTDRAKLTLRYAVVIAIIFGLSVSALTQFLSEDMVGLFTGDADVIASGGVYLQAYIFDCLFAGIAFSFSGYFCALGRSSLSFIHNLVSTVTMRVPGAYVASVLFPSTLLPMGIATVLGSVLSVVLCLLFYTNIEPHKEK